ncbi:hypothetical protein DPMN_101477 [Dreissena polymorpha]|uniref:Uncharacterized protein n=1 Tax=Dreissena polymorpha TaxID=45954 RepID=A0A9D4LJZ4_DREPO|nr:hypothetical protein DPMN_101477 [Dreissena polymorpha]
MKIPAVHVNVVSYCAQNCKEHTVVTLIGNKSDKLDTRQVTFLEAQTVSGL